ncbi:choline transporter protein 1 [Cryptomeria japonica]|uniref:choline transporter protein 1 n=1 Tax=Cryptomeria japonica TaxID=3369 RepID=UPI0027DA386A|nr:choline transporter protein 1 [Cryptomeria japonica]XP_057812897.2 choline transporter protein 1 [Cryptomeria japonica]
MGMDKEGEEMGMGIGMGIGYSETTINANARQQEHPRNRRIRERRKCRDIAFLVVFIAFLVGMVVNSSFAFNRGDPHRLVYGTDYKGNVCGNKNSKPDVREFEVRYWQSPNQVYQSGLRKSPIKLADARSVCLKECPIPSDEDVNWVCDYPEGNIKLTMDEWNDRNYDYYEFLSSEERNSSLQLQGPCYPVIFPSTNVFWSCQFAARPSNSSLQFWKQMGGVDIDEGGIIVKSVHMSINSHQAVLKRYVADVGKAWPVLIVCGGLLPLFLSVIWLVMIRYFVGVMIWATIVLLNILTFSITLFFYTKAGWIGHDGISTVIGQNAADYVKANGRELDHLRAIAVLMTIVIVVVILSTIALIKRILIAPAVLKVASKAIGAIRMMIIFPILPFAILGVFYMYWVGVALYLFSAGEIRQNDCNGNCCAYDLLAGKVKCDGCCGYSIYYTHHLTLAILYHLFGCFWITQFIMACSVTVIAGSVASYYWERGESPEMLLLPLISSVNRLLRYNLGSVALGSLVVAPIESIRYILECVRRRLKLVEAGSEGFITKTVWCCRQCCLGCIERTIKFVNRNAYIMIAITGKGFCTAAEMATGLIINNILRIGTVNVIGDVILFLGKLCVSLACALFAFLMLDTHPYKSAHDKISSPLFPVLACWGIGYVVASLFFNVVETTIDTIMLSFCQDAEEHQGTPQYAPPLLIETLGNHSEMQRLTQ